jgi:hypothetical protein
MSKTTDKVIDLMNQDLSASSNGRPKKSKFKTYKAIAAFQQECPVIHKATKGYGYTYADLASIFKIIIPLMAKHKLGFIQPIQGTDLQTIIFYYGDEDALPIESSAAIPQGVQLKGMNDFQVYGSAITYFRRYSLASQLGIITDKDIDASGEQEITKPRLTESLFLKAKESVKNGEHTIEEIEKKYYIDSNQKKQLKNV